jgi:hypothetical protein
MSGDCDADGDADPAGLAVEALAGRVVADGQDPVADQLGDVDIADVVTSPAMWT